MSNIKLSFSTNAYKKLDLLDAIQSIKEIGYQGIEIMCDIPHAYPPDLDILRITQIEQVLKTANLQIANLLILTIVLYNGWAKLHHLPGSITMGICRALNFCLGLSLFPKAFLGYVLLSIIPFAHIAAVTSLSRGENTTLSKKYVFLTALIPLLLSIEEREI